MDIEEELSLYVPAGVLTKVCLIPTVIIINRTIINYSPYTHSHTPYTHTHTPTHKHPLVTFYT